VTHGVDLPGSAQASGHFDQVLPLGDIPSKLTRILSKAG